MANRLLTSTDKKHETCLRGTRYFVLSKDIEGARQFEQSLGGPLVPVPRQIFMILDDSKARMIEDDYRLIREVMFKLYDLPFDESERMVFWH